MRFAYGPAIIAVATSCNLPPASEPTPTETHSEEWTPTHGPVEKKPEPTPEELTAAEKQKAEDQKEMDEKVAKLEAEAAAADEAEANAKLKAGEAAKAKQAAIEKEQAVLDGALKKCKAGKAACDKSCKADDGPSCMAWGYLALQEVPPVFDVTKSSYLRACALGIVTACDAIPGVEKTEREWNEIANDLWSYVVYAADEIASVRHKYAFTKAKLPQTRQNLVAEGNMLAHAKLITEQKYCPSKKDFIEKAGAKLFSVRAKRHCTENPPMGMTTLEGDEAPLTAECNAAFATACP